ncbi:uncharacterized protein LOC144444390 [Glandiceps talaboti]
MGGGIDNGGGGVVAVPVMMGGGTNGSEGGSGDDAHGCDCGGDDVMINSNCGGGGFFYFFITTIKVTVCRRHKNVVIFWERSYRVFEDVVGESRYKVNGVAYTNLSTVDPENLTVEDTAPYNRAWDAADYVIPVQMKDAFFIMTNMVITENQTQGECPEDFGIVGAPCTHDNNCTEGDTFTDGNGKLYSCHRFTVV